MKSIFGYDEDMKNSCCNRFQTCRCKTFFFSQRHRRRQNLLTISVYKYIGSRVSSVSKPYEGYQAEGRGSNLQMLWVNNTMRRRRWARDRNQSFCYTNIQWSWHEYWRERNRIGKDKTYLKNQFFYIRCDYALAKFLASSTTYYALP